MKYSTIYLLVFGIILFDQTLKLSVHFQMDYGYIGEISIVGNWFKLHYVLNSGMAFGLELNQKYGKLILTSFRILIVLGIGWYLKRLIFRKLHRGFIFSIALVLAGAIGNVLDSIFYGVFLDNAVLIEHPPFLYPWGHGQVIDMFYLDVWQGQIPENFPIWGGSYIALFPIFNLADLSILVGIFQIMLFQHKFFRSLN